ncbi:catabolite repression HPr-like protein [Thermoactinomyces sp. DSM 45891]|uniref:HPr family phosphocarrier protein n=1 Tax=Thermoactinomyces sp. DSM 45891 TaxID=1761907 RepID=UPI000912DF1C|nr:HPr family phosphocarrier protein [Thermoactinomyces sp. DSM 45891]SFX22094.1 catabolite repression HPr-like protein [Thermoactinomyces sp. DSM 45891]
MAVEKKVMVQLETGLHARPAAYFVQEANKYASQVFIEKEGRKVNAKSIMGVMSLAVAKGTEIVISAEGTDEEKAVEALAAIVMKTE